MSALILVYRALLSFLTKRYSTKGLYYIWLIIVIGLLIPFRPNLNIPIMDANIPLETTMNSFQMDNPNINDILNINNTISTNEIISWAKLIPLLWFIGMVCFFIFNIFKHWYFVKIIRRWSEKILDKDILSIFYSIKKEMNITTNITLDRCLCIGSPMMIGIFNPKILLPDTNYSEYELQFIIKHELIHFKRKDLYYKSLVLISTAVHWFNPFVYIMVKSINFLCELSCDAEVVKTENIDMRLEYSKTVIGSVNIKTRLNTALSTNIYGGKKGMKKRILSIMDTGRKKAGIVIAFFVLFSAIRTGIIFTSNSNAYADSEIKEEITSNIKSEQLESYKQIASSNVQSNELNSSQINEEINSSFSINNNNNMSSSVQSNEVESSRVNEQNNESEGIQSNNQGNSNINNKNNDIIKSKATEPKNSIDNNSDYIIYEKYGLILNSGENKLYYNGQVVRYFIDRYNNGQGVLNMWAYDLDGTIDVYAVRDNTGLQGELVGISTYSREDFDLRTMEISGQQNNVPNYDVMTFRFRKDEAPNGLQLWINQCENDVFDFCSTQQNGRYYIYVRNKTEFSYSINADGDKAYMEIFDMSGTASDGYALFSVPLYKEFTVVYKGNTKSFIQ